MTTKQLLVECITFECDPSLLEESMKSNNKPFIVKGILQRAGSKNQNGRIYPREVLQREAKLYEENFIKESRALGELDHPQSEVVNLKNASHNIVEMHWDGDDLVGTVQVLTTPSGNILKELFKSGIRLGISSRGMGTLNKLSEGSSIVGDDFSLVSFDFVSNPSTKGAFMFPEQQLSENIVHNPITNKWESIDNIIRDILAEIG